MNYRMCLPLVAITVQLLAQPRPIIARVSTNRGSGLVTPGQLITVYARLPGKQIDREIAYLGPNLPARLEGLYLQIPYLGNLI